MGHFCRFWRKNLLEKVTAKKNEVDEKKGWVRKALFNNLVVDKALIVDHQPTLELSVRNSWLTKELPIVFLTNFLLQFSGLEAPYPYLL